MTEQLGLTLFKVAFVIYLVAAICYLSALIMNKVNVAKLGRAFLLIGIVAHTASLVVITAAIGKPPFLNLYEYMLSFTWAAAVVYVVIESLMRNTAFGGFCVPVIALFVVFTELLPNGKIDESVMPALNSAWLVPHVATACLAYGAFTIAFVLAIMYLLRERADVRLTREEGKGGGKGGGKLFWVSRLPAAKLLDHTIYRTLAFGFLMQTLLLITGAIWAQFAWGRYWGWDPKETWALITWIIYAAYLHTRTVMGWRGRKSAWLAIIGFAATGFTLIGVSFLLSGLHSYAGK